MSKSFNANFQAATVGTPASNPPVPNPLVLPVSTSDNSITIPAGWYDVHFQGNDAMLQQGAACVAGSSPAFTRGTTYGPRWYGTKAQKGGATAAPVVMHGATFSGTGYISFIPQTALSTP